MTSARQDEFLTWVNYQKEEARKALQAPVGNTTEYYRGRLNAMLDVIAFILTEGKLK